MMNAGDEVRICGSHPWVGTRGKIVRWANMPFSNKPAYIVRLSTGDAMEGHECYVEIHHLQTVHYQPAVRKDRERRRSK